LRVRCTGLARTTADIDLVIDPEPDAIELLTEHLERDRYYVHEVTAREALAVRDQFNVIDTGTGWKVGLIIVKDRPFSVTEFNRRIPITVLGVPVFVATAEDTVLAKLEWSRLGGSDRQRQDVVEVLRLRRSDIDNDYLDHWAGQLDLVDLLATVRRSATI